MSKPKRRRKLQAARDLRKQKNIKMRQSAKGGIPYAEEQTVPYPKAAIVSL